MTKRVCAAVLIVLAISPVTAPFATADLADFLHGHFASASSASLQAPAGNHKIDSEALVIPTLTPKSGYVPAAVSSAVDAVLTGSGLAFIRRRAVPVCFGDLVVHRVLPRSASVLRI